MKAKNVRSSMKPKAWIGWLLLAIAGCASPQNQDSSYRGGTVETKTVAVVERGPGAEHCAEMDQVVTELDAKRFDRTRSLLDGMQARFAAFESPGKRVMSFGSQAEFEDHVATDGDPESIVPVDICYATIFLHQGFAAAAEHDYLTGLEWLERAVSAGPTMASPLTERGYVLSRLGRHQDARVSYEDAIRLAERYSTSSDRLPIALRGLGYALIELEQLDEAESAFRRSLEIDPDNALAQHELRYIESLRRSQR